MSAFREQDAEFFFGRETFVDGLVRVVQQQPLVAVIGSSGSGKSSVVLAGLIPKLREEGSWLIESFRPNKLPFYELAAALIGQLEPELGKTDKNIKAKELAESIRKHGFTADVSAILKDKPGKRLLLAIDQFEELYTGCADTVQQQFVDALLAAIESASRTVTLVLTLRADFYSYVVNYPPLGEALNKYPAQNLTLMKAQEMQAAIELPADKMNVKLEEKLTERILNDVKQEPGNLPLLEFALTQLWAKQSRGQLTHQAYSEIGGVAKALSNHAEAVYGKLNQGEQKKQAQRIFLQLVRPGEGTEDTRRVATRGEVGNWELVTFLAGEDARLVVTGRNEATGEETVEVVHEALIREWGLLRQWIDENRKKLIQKREIEDAAKRWRDNSKEKDYLLQGKVLTEARVFQKQEGANLKLSDLAKVFIRQSLGQRRIRTLTTASFFTVPLAITFLGVIPYWRETNLQRAWQTITTRGEGTREALQVVTEGCRERKILGEIPDSLAALFFGNCRSLKGRDLKGIKLNGADLSGADLSYAKLSYADLSKANLSDADLSYGKLSNTDFTYANLSDANLSDADLRGAKFFQANLSDADLSDADLRNTSLLSFAKLSNADFSGADLRDNILWGVNFSRVNLKGAQLSGAQLSGADFSRANLMNTNLIGANLRDANLKGSLYTKETRFPQNFTPSNHKMYLIGPSADLRDADLRDADLRDADLRDADLRDADLRDADLRGADLRGADLRDADLSCFGVFSEPNCTNFKGAKNLTPKQVKSAENWEEAEYDKEFRKKLGLKEKAGK